MFVDGQTCVLNCTVTGEKCVRVVDLVGLYLVTVI
jgi:hypothetical protein